ncbi:MAG: hypothetical protein J5934_02865 [Succinivibrio sp.]|nr:hypothetical protein [Succinivibrio sp.]
MPLKTKRIINSVISLSAAALALSLSACSKNEDKAVVDDAAAIEPLSKWAESMRSSLPMKLNEQISLTDLKVGPSRRLEYVYVINIPFEAYKQAFPDQKAFIKDQETALNTTKKSYCNGDAMKSFRENGIFVHYTYFSSDNKPLFEIEDFNQEICKLEELPKLKVSF